MGSIFKKQQRVPLYFFQVILQLIFATEESTSLSIPGVIFVFHVYKRNTEEWCVETLSQDALQHNEAFCNAGLQKSLMSYMNGDIARL
jgi:hypothetical protein